MSSQQQYLGQCLFLYPSQTNYSQIFINCHVWNRGLQNQTEKVPCTVSLNVPKCLSSLCLQGLFQTFIGCDYRTQSRVLKNESKMSFSQKICRKKHTHVPNAQNSPRFNTFWFLILILCRIYIGQWQVLFMTQE